MFVDERGELHVRGAAAAMGGNTSRPEQRFNVERGDMNHRSPRDDRDDTMQSYRPRADSPPRSDSRHQSGIPRSEREQVWFSADTYRPSPRSPFRQRSPPNLRHSFRPERREASPTCDSYRPKPGSRRPDLDDRRLDCSRRPSPPRRSSAFTIRGQSSPVMSSKSPHHADDKDLHKRKVIMNPTWKRTAASSPTKAPAKVEYNGAKDVPSGPAKPSHQPDSHKPVPEHVKRSPHIFISSQHLPASTTTIVHLKGYLRQHQPVAVHIDDSGYYLQYPNTANGKLALRKCKEAYDGKPLFAMYTLVMQSFPNGQPAGESTIDNTAPSFPSVIAAVGGQEGSNGTTIPSICDETSAETEMAELNEFPQEQTVTDHRSAKTTGLQPHNRGSQISMSDPAQPEPPFAALEDDAFMSASRSSPPRGIARSFHDDAASSVSGCTSEVSASGRSCHVCKQRSELDNLVRCSTCSRRYHRYCHTRMPLPATLGPAWQCQRCLKKKVSPKRTLTAFMDGDAAGVFDSPGPPAAKKTKLDNAAIGSSPKDQNHASATAVDATALNHGRTAETSTAMDSSLLQEASDVVISPSATDRTVLESTVPAPLKAPISTLPTEADDLVEKAFTSRDGPDNAPKKPIQLDLVRRKAKVGPPNDDLSHASHEVPDQRKVQKSTANSPVDEGASKLVVQSPAEPPTVDTERQGHGSTTSADERVGAEATAATQEAIAADQNLTKRDSSSSLLLAPDSSKRVKAQHIKDTRVDCTGCGKLKVPRAPSGKMLCVPCKRKERISGTQASALVEPAAKTGSFAEKESQLSPRLEPAYFAKDATVPVSATADNASRLPPLIDGGNGASGQVASEPACKDCRRRHKKCEHRSRPPAVTCQDCRKRHIRCEHGTVDDEDDDLDFWSTKVPSTCERCGGTHDPTQCSVQSFPATQGFWASDQLYAVIARSQGNGLWAKGNDSSQALASMQSEKRNDVDRDPQLPNTQARSPVSAEAEAPHPASQPERTGLKRKSQRRAAVDENDLGDSHTRPKGTFSRLIGMALYDAPGNRSDPTSVVAWVDQNIPGYDKSQGTWPNGLKATMILNSQGKSGTPRAAQVIEGGRKLYQMLPHMVDTHERWDSELQRPVVPEGVHRPLEIGAEDDMDDDDLDVEDAALPGPSQKSPQIGRSKPNSFNLQPRGGQLTAEDQTDIDKPDTTRPIVDEDGLAGVYDSSVDEPLANCQGSSVVAPTAPMATIKSPLHHDGAVDQTPDRPLYRSFDNPIGMQSGLVRVVERTSLTGPTRDLQLPDELSLRALIRDQLENQDYCAKSLEDEWPELHPDFQVDKKAKLAEIKARPRRKQLFGRALNVGTVNDLNDWHPHSPAPFPVLRHDPFPGAQNDEEEDGTKSKRCKTLEDFLGVPDDLEPHILEKELVYRHRNSRIRTVYKTGI